MTKQKLIKGLIRTFMMTCNPPPRQFYGSIMLLRNKGRLVLREPKAIRTVLLVP